MKKTILVAGAALISVSAFAAAPAAQPQQRVTSTGEIVQLCKDKANAQVQSYCNGFGQGVYDSYLVTRHPKAAPSKICVKQPAPQRQQVLDEYVAWAEAKPAIKDMPAAESALRFLAERFPCSTAKAGK